MRELSLNNVLSPAASKQELTQLIIVAKLLWVYRMRNARELFFLCSLTTICLYVVTIVDCLTDSVDVFRGVHATPQKAKMPTWQNTRNVFHDVGMPVVEPPAAKARLPFD